MDYKAIGIRIRKLRKAKGISQDDLRYMTKISKTHMSHIETGTTKASLPTIISLANALETSVDYLLSDNVNASTPIFRQEIEEILYDCSLYEYKSIIEAMKFTKKTIRNCPVKESHD